MNRFRLLLAISVILVVVNLWRWWPSIATQDLPDANSNSIKELNATDFMLEISIGIPEQEQKIYRDLFHSRSVDGRSEKTVKIVPPKPVVTRSSKEEKAPVQQDVKDIYLSGIALRSNNKHAFLVYGEENYTASVGDKIGSNYIVERIDAEGVSLVDKRNETRKRLLLNEE